MTDLLLPKVKKLLLFLKLKLIEKLELEELPVKLKQLNLLQRLKLKKFQWFMMQ